MIKYSSLTRQYKISPDLKASPSGGPVSLPHVALTKFIPTRHETGLKLD